MGQQRDADWYDQVYLSPPAAHYSLPPDEAPWAGIWAWCVDQMPSEARSVVDLGCGPGHFLEMLHLSRPDINATGVDFSGVAIQMAEARGLPNEQFRWVHGDIFTFSDLEGVDVVVCTEVLEHVEGDLDLLAALPKGMTVLGTVPPTLGPSHVRSFACMAEVVDRYERVLAIQAVKTVNGLYCFRGTVE